MDDDPAFSRDPSSAYRAGAGNQQRAHAATSAASIETQILQSVAPAVVAVDLDGRVIYWNRSAESLYGWRSEEVLGRIGAEFMVPAPSLATAREIARVTRIGKTWSGEVILRRRDGSEFQARTMTAPLRDESGQLIGRVATIRDVTDQVQNEAALRKSQASLANAQRIAKLGSWDMDPETGRLEWSDQHFEIFGIEKEGFSGSFDEFMERVHPDDRERVRQISGAAAAGEGPLDFDFRIMLPGGTHKLVHARGDLRDDEHGRPRLSGTVLDITDRWWAEEALRASEERFAATFEQAPVGICELRADGTLERINPRFCAMFGWPRDELAGGKFADLVHADELPQTQAMMSAVWKGDREVSGVDKRCVRRDGSVFWAHCTVSLMRDRDGNPQSLIAILKDISARKAAEELLRFQANMLDSVADAVIATAMDGTIIYLNKYAESLYGWSKDEAMGRDILELLVPEGRDRTRADAALEVLRNGGQSSGEYLLRRRDGSTFHALSSTRAVFGEEGAIHALVGISNDISERKRVQQQLVDSEAQLRALTARLQNLREEERTRISREIHDELGQLLTGLKMDLRWVERRLEQLEGEKVRPLVDRIVAATELTESAITAVQAIAADLRPVVLDSLGLAAALEFEGRRFQHRTGVLCRIRRPAEMPALRADVTTALFRIFQECLTNVARHSGATAVDVLLELRGTEVHLAVHDNGSGNPDLERAAAGSLGLLGITERAALLGGAVSFSSAERTGTTVDVRLPGAIASPDASPDR